MTRSLHLSLALTAAAGLALSGCTDAAADAVAMPVFTVPAIQQVAEPHRCRADGTQSTQKGCRPMARVVGSGI